jgi:alditol oxidase
MFNWAGNLEYGTNRVHEAGSVEQIRAVLKSHEKVKVQGTRHCFNSIADSRENLLTLTSREMSIDAQAGAVTVDAGVTYGQLGPYLEEQGFGLHNLASLPHISIAGACSTATHGSGERNGNLATAVRALEMVTADGEVVKLARGSGDFAGAVVGLGALGVITRLTLDLEPAYSMRQYVYEDLRLAEMRDHFDEIQASGYSVSLFTDWREQRVRELWIKAREAFAAPPELFGARLATRKFHPIGELSAEHCTEQMGLEGPWYDRLPHFRMGFTPSAGQELQTEYFVPRRNAVDAILAVERLRDEIAPLLLISEIRTIAEDDLWMSPCYRRASVAIHFTWKPDWTAVRGLLPRIEKELAPFEPRPHWGKLFTMIPSGYEKLAEFRGLAAKYDPAEKFRNDFLNSNVLTASV